MNGGDERITLRGAPVVQAPGKVFLIGEYAVLEGAPAVVSAISRQASAQYIPGLDPASPVIDLAVKGAVAALGELGAALPRGSVLVDSQAFVDAASGQKLGFGSSAAAAVATVGAVFEYCGRPITETRETIFTVADEAHRAAQNGVGSGADVACSTFGGALHFQRGEDDAPVRETLDWPEGLQLVVLWTGRSASTAEMVKDVFDLAERTPPLFKWLMDEMKTTAGRFASAFGAGRQQGVIETMRVYNDLLGELGRSAGRSIVTPPVQEAAKLAESLGGAAKPSGAGGGDLAVALFPDIDAVRTFSARCPAALKMLDVRPVATGVQRRLASIVEVVHPR